MWLSRPAAALGERRNVRSEAAFVSWHRLDRWLFALALALLACACHKPDPELQQGAELYARMCSVCHGAQGEGYKADQATKLAQPDFLDSVGDEYLRVAITNGRSGTPMSAWGKSRGGPLSAEQVNFVIKFIRNFRHAKRPELDNSPLKGDQERGRIVYDAQCVSCHGARGIGGPNVHIGNRELLDTASNGFLRYAIANGRSGTKMPAFAAKLKPEEIDSVIVTLRSFLNLSAPFVPPPPVPPLPLGPVPLNPKGPEPKGFLQHPQTTPLEVVKSELDRGARMVLLDARAPSDYVNEHIRGAVSVPFYDPAPYLKDLPKNAWLVCYCACPHAESGQLAQKLVAAGFKKVTVLNEGLNLWRNKQYPISKGEKP